MTQAHTYTNTTQVWIVQIQILNRTTFGLNAFQAFSSSLSVHYYSTRFFQFFSSLCLALGHTLQKCQIDIYILRMHVYVWCKIYTGALSHTAHTPFKMSCDNNGYIVNTTVGCWLCCCLLFYWFVITQSYIDDVHQSKRSYTKSQFKLSLFTHSLSLSLSFSISPSVDISLHLLFAFRCYIITLEKETTNRQPFRACASAFNGWFQLNRLHNRIRLRIHA